MGIGQNAAQEMPRAHLVRQSLDQAAVELDPGKGQARKPPAVIAERNIIKQHRNAKALQAQHDAAQAGGVADCLGFRQLQQKRTAPFAMLAESRGKPCGHFREQ